MAASTSAMASCSDDDSFSEAEESLPVSHESMTMEELILLQEEMGTKEFAAKVLNVEIRKKSMTSKPSKRANKNRPTEMPLVRRVVPRMASLDPGATVKKHIVRDPRFDDLSGALDMKAWKHNFDFLRKARLQERDVLKHAAAEETDDPVRAKQMKLGVQRMENQQREQARREQEHEMKRQERMQRLEALKQGRQPHFLSRKERKLKLKAAQFEQLRKDNKVDKYMERKEKKLTKRERVAMQKDL